MTWLPLWYIETVVTQVKKLQDEREAVSFEDLEAQCMKYSCFSPPVRMCYYATLHRQSQILVIFLCVVLCISYTYFGACLARVWPCCHPVVFQCWQIDQAHDDDQGYELLQLLLGELLT